jgi:histidinol-phosphate aminotransferase
VPVPELADGVVRLAFNESPLGPFPAALAAMHDAIARAGRYPEADGRLIERLAAAYGMGPSMVALGNGADAIIGHLTAAFVGPGDEVLTGWPSFPTYVLDACKQGASVVRVGLRDGAFDLDAMLERIGPRTRLVWVCTPNNPTGGAVCAGAFGRFIDGVPEDVVVAVDEAYFEFAGEPGSGRGAGPRPRPAAGPGSGRLDAVAAYAGRRANVAVLRTFSKLYGLAGLRVGYLIAAPELVTAVAKARNYYDITGVSLVAAFASLDHPDEVERRRAETARGRERLAAGLASLGLAVLPSEANFVAADVGDADAVSARLLAAGVATRSLSGLGEPGLLRITVGSDAEVDRLLEVLAGSG